MKLLRATVYMPDGKTATEEIDAQTPDLFEALVVHWDATNFKWIKFTRNGKQQEFHGMPFKLTWDVTDD